MGGGNELAQGLLQGQSIRQNWQQSQDQGRTRAAAQAFQQAAQGKDITKPEGMGAAIKAMSDAGFADEARRVFEAHKDMFQEMAPKPTEYDFREDATGLLATPKNDPTKAVRVPGYVPKPEKAAAEKYQLVKNKKGQMVSVDVSTGLDKNGKPVDAWQDPVKPDAPKSTDIFSQEQQLRTQYLGQTKDFRDVRDAYSRIQTSAKDPSAAGDLALIFNYMKMLDPGSTVREGEFANAQNAGGIPERIWSSYNKAMSGERLAPPQRADFINRAKGLYGKAEFQKKKTQAEYRKMAGSYPGLNPDRILMDDDIAIEPAPSPASAKAHPQDSEAVQWAKVNPNDPRAAAILKANGL